MNEPLTPQQRAEASLHIHKTVLECLDSARWTPHAAVLLLCGLRAAPDCAELVGLLPGLEDGVPRNLGDERYFYARHFLKRWDNWMEAYQDDPDSYLESHGEIHDRMPPQWFVVLAHNWVEEGFLQFDNTWLAFFCEAIGLLPPFWNTKYLPIQIALEVAQPPATIQTDSIPAKKSSSKISNHLGRQFLTTEELAAALYVEPETIQKRYSQTGSYHGVVPTKLRSRRLAWPLDAVERIMGAEPDRDQTTAP